jgi:hypothetical protein
MNIRTFKCAKADQPRGGDVWFHLRYDGNGVLVGVEEHDNYQGGPIQMIGESWEHAFLEAVKRRAPGALPQAKTFLDPAGV